MIPITAATEPAKFEKLVRRKGLDAMAEMIGQKPAGARRGPKRKKIVDRHEDIPPSEFPTYWRDVLADMHSAYQGRCAYSALYLEHGTGSPSVDHFIPKSKDWRLVYEWSNYRLACSLINSKKSDSMVELDPFSLSKGLFALEFTAFQVSVGGAATGDTAARVKATIETLGLNAPELCAARGEYVVQYELGAVTLDYLTRRAPFVTSELRRQGLLLREDV